MRNLSKANLAAAADVLGSLYETSSVDEFGSRLCETLPSLISADFVSYNELDTPHQRALVIMEPFPIEVTEHKAAFDQYVITHPYMKPFAESGDSTAKRIDDVSSYREFIETPVYREFYKYLSVRDQLIAFLTSDGGLNIGIAVTRCDSPFTAGERDLMEYLRPRLFRAYRVVQRTNALQMQRRGLQMALENGRGSFVMCSTAGDITFASLIGEETLRRWFKMSQMRLTRLPEVLLRHVTGARQTERSVQFARGGQRLIISFFKVGSQVGLHLTEAVRTLKRYDLSPREIEVLKWVAEGKRNEEIAKILGISAGTVKRHVDHILQKLHVETRTAAASLFHRSNV